jgi:hypothetical protein
LLLLLLLLPDRLEIHFRQPFGPFLISPLSLIRLYSNWICL